jgi:hypothetical protein
MKTTRLGLAGIICALALSMGLAGCSAIKLGYNNFPEVAYWWLDGYVDFSDAQAPRVRQQLGRLQAWHRQQELPRFVELLARMEQMAPGTVSPQQACGVVADVQARLIAVADQAEPAVVGLARELTPAQLRHLERKYRGNNEDFAREWIAPAPPEQREKRYEQALDRLESIYGRLDEPQRAVLRRGAEQSIYNPARVLQERQRRQQDLLQTLRRTTDPAVSEADARGLMRAYLDRAAQSPDTTYRAWQDQLLQEGCRLFAAVHESTTPQQREQAARRLRAYQRDLRDLAVQR